MLLSSMYTAPDIRVLAAIRIRIISDIRVLHRGTVTVTVTVTVPVP
jgi:hypothetical protein